MKNRVIFSFAICFCHVVFAQDDHKLLKDGVTMREGKMYKIDKDGNVSPYNGDIEFGNKTKVSKYGDITYISGLKTKMHDGEIMLKDGYMGILASSVKQLDGYIFKEGKSMEILPTDLRSIDGDRVVADSNKLTIDGKYYLGNSGKFIQLLDGEIVTSKGEVYSMNPVSSEVESYVTKRDSVVIKAVNNKMAVIQSDYLFPNGIKVTPQGLVSVKEGVSFTLRSGEKLDSKGDLYLNNEFIFSDGIVKRDGFVFVVKNGSISQINEDYVIDTVTVSPNGSISYANRADKFLMRDGDVLGLNGMLKVAPTGGGVGGSSKDRFILDHVIYKDSKLFLVKDGETSLLTKDIVLTDGAKVLRTGQIIKANGSKILLHEGQRIALSGEEMPDQKPEESSNPDKNYFTMLKGRMWQVTEGKPSLLKEDFNIHGKMVVRMDGTVMKSDGRRMMLKENDRLSLDGVMIPTDKRPVEGQLPNEYYIMKLGKMWIVKDGKPTRILKDTTTPDGAKIMMDGTIIKKDKQKLQLKEGDKVDSKGEHL